jgi:hypothetical protein
LWIKSRKRLRSQSHIVNHTHSYLIKPKTPMKIEELEQLADNAIARWENPNLPKPPGEPTVKFCSPTRGTDLLPGLTAQRIGTTRAGMEVMLVNAIDLKKAIARFKQEF